MTRRVFGAAANRLARGLIDSRISDYTNGFRFYSPGAVEVLLGHAQHRKGYIYLSESMAYLLKADMRVATFPIQFKNRERGSSNTGVREILAALFGIVSIAVDHRRTTR